MLTITHDCGLVVLYSPSTRSTLELTVEEAEWLQSQTGQAHLANALAQLHSERASDSAQRVAPKTERSPKGGKDDDR